MYNNDYFKNNIYLKRKPFYPTIRIYDRSGNRITALTEDSLKKRFISGKVTADSGSDSGFPIGCVVSRQCEMEFNNTDGFFNNHNLNGGKIEIRYKSGTSSTSVYFTGTISCPRKSGSSTKITAYDSVYLLDKALNNFEFFGERNMVITTIGEFVSQLADYAYGDEGTTMTVDTVDSFESVCSSTLRSNKVVLFVERDNSKTLRELLSETLKPLCINAICRRDDSGLSFSMVSKSNLHGISLTPTLNPFNTNGVLDGGKLTDQRDEDIAEDTLDFVDIEPAYHWISYDQDEDDIYIKSIDLNQQKVSFVEELIMEEGSNPKWVLDHEHKTFLKSEEGEVLHLSSDIIPIYYKKVTYPSREISTGGTLATHVYTQLAKSYCRRFQGKHIQNVCWDVFDTITLYDTNGVSHCTILTKVVQNILGTSELYCEIGDMLELACDMENTDNPFQELEVFEQNFSEQIGQ